MSAHLPILQAMFPNKVLLDIDDIAQCLSFTKKYIYKLSSQKKLKFKLVNVSDKILVSIVELARYLDSELAQEAKQEEEKPPVPSLIKKKRGRPLGSKTGAKALLQMQFQHQLSLAIVKVEMEEAFSTLEDELEAFQYPDNGKPCSDTFAELKGEALTSARRARSAMMATMLDLSLDRKKPPVKRETIKV